VNATAAQLKEHYARMDTEELVELRAKNTLTDVAREVLDLELRNRGVAESAVVHEQARQVAQVELRETEIANMAPLLRRAAAYIVDVPGTLILLSAINFPVYLYTPKGVSDAVGWASLAAWMVYVVFKDGFNGQSLGKRLLRIKVLEKQSGEPCSLPKSLIRNILHSMGIVDWVFVLGRERRRLGDLAANTCVVRIT
jgi:uncharacterized RDD family membrane protein YckC